MRHLLCALAISLPAMAVGAPQAPLMTVLIKPSAMDEASGKGDVAVTIAVPAMAVAPGEPLFTLGSGAPGMPSPQPLEDLTITDDRGEVPLQPRDERGIKPWASTRAVSGTVVARYRLPIDNARGSTPPIVLRIDGNAFSTPGRMLVAVPQVQDAYRLRIEWDLAAMGAGAIGVSSWGDGDVEVPAGSAARLASAVFIAGHLQRVPTEGSPGFSALWAGDPPFDPRPMMQWTGQLHAWMSRFFGDDAQSPYRVILRRNPRNPGGGVALIRSFVVGYGVETRPEGLKSILAHEMTHTWTAIESMGKWYNEGNAVYYQELLPWRAGLITTEQYLAGVNRTASRYYTGTMKHTPEEHVLAQFWDDTRIRVLPYDRGALYFAVLNGKVRRASRGERSIDDLIRVMVRRERRGESVTEKVWLDLLRQEIGEAGLRTHRAMMAGELVLPESDDYGPCFKRVAEKIRIFEPGFDLKAATAGSERVIRALVAGSAAAKAGLREGDKVVSAPLGDAVQADVARRITVEVLRDGRPLAFTYLPRGAAVDAYQWRRIPSVPDARCK